MIATSTKVDISKVDVATGSIGDDYFSLKNDSQKLEVEAECFKEDSPKDAIVSDQRKADQQKIDDV